MRWPVRGHHRYQFRDRERGFEQGTRKPPQPVADLAGASKTTVLLRQTVEVKPQHKQASRKHRPHWRTGKANAPSKKRPGGPHLLLDAAYARP
jgi:hypothetical protein